MMAQSAALLALALSAACGTEQATAPHATEQPAGPPEVTSPERPPEPEAAEPVHTCVERVESLEARVEAIAREHRACRYDVECVAGGVVADCYSACGVALHPRGVAEIAALTDEMSTRGCAEWAAAGCPPHRIRCEAWVAACIDGQCSTQGSAIPADVPAPIPHSTSADPDAPTRRPPAGPAEEKARRLFDAIVHDDPSRASDFFFPREAFLRVKAIADPGGYWDRLYRRYAEDIGALHDSTPDLARAQFDRLEIVGRGGWVAVGEEGNALPYWASRHSWLHYTVDGAPRKLEIRVLITWDDEWWITHLSEFR